MTSTWQEEEKKVKTYLEWLFKQPFSKKSLEVAIPGGRIRNKEFDAVSEDGCIVAQVKAYRSAQPQEIRTALSDVTFLALAQAQTRLMFFTDELFYQMIWRMKGHELLEYCRMGVRLVSPWELNAFKNQ